jgi:hypothetical protein
MKGEAKVSFVTITYARLRGIISEHIILVILRIQQREDFTSHGREKGYEKYSYP